MFCFRENILRTDGGVRESAQHAKTQMECFELYITSQIVEKVAFYTNKRISWLENLPEEDKELMSKSDKFSYVKKTDVIEIRAFIG